MPTLDVSNVLLDPHFAATMKVLRRQQLVSDLGKVSTDNKCFARVSAVICMASPNDLKRFEEFQAMDKVLSIVTKFRLRGPSEKGQADVQYQPDLIHWQGSWYVVKVLEPYTQYGRGQVQAFAASIDFIDEAPS